ncbi:outer membrane beta-barrel protein [Lacinutrix undariae]
MKKLSFTAAITVLGLSNVNAQEEAKTFGFGEGDIFIEGTVGFYSTNDKNTDEKTNGFGISPKAGCFLNDDLDVGAMLSYDSNKIEVSGTDLSKTNTFGAGVFARYYVLDLGKRFKTYSEFGIGYATSNDKILDLNENTIGAGLDLGINYFVTEKIALSFGLKNILSFSSAKYDVSGAKPVTDFSFGFLCLLYCFLILKTV